MYNEGEDEGKHKGKRCKGEAEGEQREELNDERLYEVFRWKGESTSSVQFTDGQSEDRPVYSGRLYIHLYCLYICGFANKSTNR